MKHYQILAPLFLWTTVQAEVFTDGSFRYESKSDSSAECTLLGFVDATLQNSGQLVIPSLADNDGKTYVVTGIAPKAFLGSDITEVRLSSNLREIGEGAFSSCKYLSIVNFGENTNIIGDQCFMDDVSLKSIVLPSSIETVGNGVFRGCTSLKNVTLSTNIFEIPNNFFEDCLSLTQVYSDKKIIGIGERSFANCISITDFDFDSLEYMGERCFSGCRSLKSLVLNQQLTEIPDGAFEHCSSINSILFGSNIQAIGKDAFDGCSSLREIEIGREVSYVGSNAFGNCAALRKIYTLNSIAPSISFDTFSASTYHLATLYVRVDSESLYRQAAYWENFDNIIGTTLFPVAVESNNYAEKFSCSRAGRCISLRGEKDTDVSVVTIGGIVLFSGKIGDGIEVDVEGCDSPILIISEGKKILCK